MAWSENYKYKNPDVTGLVNNVKRMMGVDSGAAGRRSRNMSDFLTGAKTEGQQLKNIMLNNKNQAFIQGIDDPALKKMFGKFLGTILSNPNSASSVASAYGTGQNYQGKLEEQAAKVLAQQQIAKQEGHKAGIGGLREGLAKQIAAMGLPVNIKDYDLNNPNEMRGHSNALDQQQIDSGILESLAQRFGILGDKPHTTTTDVTGARGERETLTKEKKAEATISYTKARQLAVEKYSEKQVKLAEEKAKKVISDMNINVNIGHERVNNLRQVGLDAALIAQEKKLNLKETNALIKERIKEAGFKTSIAEKGKETAEAKKDRAVNLAKMTKLELDALPDEIKGKAQRLLLQIQGDEETIKKIKSQRQSSDATRALRISQNRLANNKDQIQKLLAPHQELLAKSKADNEVNKFTQQTKNIMLKDRLGRETGTRTIDNWGWNDDVDTPLDRQQYAKVESGLLAKKEQIKTGLTEQQLDKILGVIIEEMGVTTKEAKIIYDEITSGF